MKLNSTQILDSLSANLQHLLELMQIQRLYLILFWCPFCERNEMRLTTEN